MSSSAEWRKPRSGSTSPSGSSPRSGTASGSRGRTDGYGRHPDRHPHFRGRRVHRDGLLADRSRRGRPDPRQGRLDRWRRSAHRAGGTEGCARYGAGGGGRPAAGGGGRRGAGRFDGAPAGQGAGRGGGETGPRGKAYGVYVMQFPPFPPGQPDLNYVIHQLTPFAVLILMFMGVRWVLRSPVGEALAERIRHRTPGRWAVAGEDPQRVAALEEQVAHLQGQ